MLEIDAKGNFYFGILQKPSIFVRMKFSKSADFDSKELKSLYRDKKYLEIHWGNTEEFLEKSWNFVSLEK